MQEFYATIDLGSNSFHMLTAALEHGEIKILDSVSDKVMLAEGLSKTYGIHPDAMQRGEACIERFAQRIESIPKENIRIVGTNTLRAAINASDYCAKLEKILGSINIDIISGVEEARLIYLGVNHSWSCINQHSKNLVADIGGGSTELILGKNFKLKNAESLRVGCVSFRRYFPEEKISKTNFQKAYQAALFELAKVEKDYPKKQWKNAIGSAGTFRAIEQILVDEQLATEGISYSALKQLKKRLLSFQHFDEISLAGLKPLREKTIVPGVAIALAIFETFQIELMHVSAGGLREGVLYDLVGRHKAEDIRERSVRALSRRYHVPEFKAKLYRKIAQTLNENFSFEQNARLPDKYRLYLDWAAASCRIGLAINHSQYHKHSGYLVFHSEMSGFSLMERQLLAAIVQNHRRKLDLEFLDLPIFGKENKTALVATIFLLRLSHLIGQNGKTNKCETIKSEVDNRQLTLRVDKNWLNRKMLIRHAIKQEKLYWQAAGYQLNLEFSEG